MESYDSALAIAHMFNSKFAVATDAVVLIDHTMFSTEQQHDGADDDETEGNEDQPPAPSPKQRRKRGGWRTMSMKKQRLKLAKKIKAAVPLTEAEEQVILQEDNLAMLPMSNRWALFNLWRQRAQHVVRKLYSQEMEVC